MGSLVSLTCLTQSPLCLSSNIWLYGFLGVFTNSLLSWYIWSTMISGHRGSFVCLFTLLGADPVTSACVGFLVSYSIPCVLIYWSLTVWVLYWFGYNDIQWHLAVCIACHRSLGVHYFLSLSYETWFDRFLRVFTLHLFLLLYRLLHVHILIQLVQ